jgi:hypothetical protein
LQPTPEQRYDAGVHPTFCLHRGFFRIAIDFLKRVSALDHNPDTGRASLAAS